MPLPSHQLTGETAVSLHNVSKSYDDRRAVSGLTLAIGSGEFLAILGPSGSGKTTAIRIIAGFEKPDEGEVLIAGKNVTHLIAEKRDVNTVFQSYALFPHLNVLDNVAYGSRMRGISRKARHAKAYELLELVHLTEVAERRPHELSGGMQQRVALARALTNEPAVLLFDEPLGALDRKLRSEMQRELRLIQRESAATFVYVTHDQDEAFGMADRFAVMRDGRFEQFGVPAEVYDRPANAWVARFVGGANTIRGRVTRIAGDCALLSSPLGLIEAAFSADDLASGDASLAIVRPEVTRIGRHAAEGCNRIAAHLIDIAAIGPSLRLRAVTADGSTFESIEHRCPDASTREGLMSGERVFVSFDAASVRAYRDDDTA
jgi:ABC-type Fe3+/spermidine/putrescine transport system ATPase subunit